MLGDVLTCLPDFGGRASEQSQAILAAQPCVVLVWLCALLGYNSPADVPNVNMHACLYFA